MESFKNILNIITKDNLTDNEVVSLIELLSTKIDIKTISGMARQENKTPRGIRISNNYKKVEIGDAVLCVKGVRHTF